MMLVFASNDLTYNKAADCEVYSGVGISLKSNSEQLIVGEILSGSPAAKSNLKVNDQIISVDGLSVEDREPRDVVMNLIRGSEGQFVQLEVSRLKLGQSPSEDTYEIIRFNIQRERIDFCR